MTWAPLPLDAPLSAYEAQAADLLDGWRARRPDAVRRVAHGLPRFRRADVPWLMRPLTEAEVLAEPIDLADTRAVLAREYDLLDWDALVTLVTAAQDPASPVGRFERAVDTLVTGEVSALEQALARAPDLVSARSTRRCPFDPPVHRATLLHYVAANGVEGYRQRTPSTIVECTRVLLDAGADPNALADLYGGSFATLPLLVSSSHPAQAGVQVALVDLLVSRGAHVDAGGRGTWESPLMTALAFGMHDAARALVRHGATVSLAAAAGLGETMTVADGLETSTPDERHRALALAAQHGHAGALRVLLEAGEDPDRFNPPGLHAHATPLHHAVLGRHMEAIDLLLAHGARTDIPDRTHGSTAIGWAQYFGHDDIVARLRS